MRRMLTTIPTLAFFLALAAGASGCQQGGDGAKARAAEISSLPGLKVMISGAGALGPDEVRAISKHLEGKGDVAAAMVRLKKEDGGPDGVEIELWGASLPAAAGVAGDLQGAFPALAGATIEVWKAWLTGILTALMPAALKVSTTFSTAAVAPPMTAWELELMLAMTT